MDVIMTYVQPFFGWLLQTTLIASVVICLILAAQKTLGGKLGPRWCHALWLVLLIRMVLPWAPSSRISLLNLVPSWDRQIQRQQLSEATEQHEPSQVAQASGATEAIPAQRPEPDVAIEKQTTPKPGTLANIQKESKPRLAPLRRVLPVLWFAGATVIGAYLLVSNFTLWRIVKREGPLVNQEMLELFEKCKAQMGVQTLVAVVPSDQIRSPALFGFIRPRLLLPREMLEKAGHEEMRYVFLHELAHLKRRDIYVGWLTSFLQVLHWFNPLVWFAFYRMRSDREFACDALVLARTQKEESQEYGRAIVGLLRRFSRSRPLPAMAGILETKTQLKRRITMIARFKKNSYQWSPLAVILIIILSCVSLPDARRTKASGISDAEPARHITLRRVWSDSYGGSSGAPSPDSRYLSYTDWQTGDLAIYDIAAGSKRRLTNKGSWDTSEECAYSSVWSPDSRQIAYFWEMDDGSAELRVIGLDDAKPRILYRDDETEWARLYDWSPDGEQILACLLGKNEEGRIALVSAADGSVRALKVAGKYPDWPKDMNFSPDGRHIVYSYPQKEGSKNHDISVMSTDGSREILLVEHPAHDFVVGWAPNGKDILFASDRTGTLGIWLIATADGKPRGAPRLVKQNVGRFEPLGFTKKGSYYYCTSTANDDVYVATLDQKTGTILAPPKKAIQRYEGSILAAAYSPDGKYLAYIYSHNRGKTLCIRSLETGQEQEFPFNLDSIRRFSSLRWSPDGRSILVSADDETDNVVIYGFNVQTGEVKPIVPSHTGEWSGDGKAIFYVRNDRQSEISKILFRDLETGKEKEFYQSSPDFFFNISLSPDGQWLALRCTNPTSLKILPVTGGEPRELPEFEKVATIHKPIAWTADSKYILFSGNEPGGGKHPLYRISAESGKIKKLGLQMNRYHALSAHPDGRRILVSCSESGAGQEVWVMENFLPGAPVAKPARHITLRQVWSGPGVDFYGAPSPDGRYLSYVDWGATDLNHNDLAIYEIATGKKRRLTDNASWYESDEYQFALYSIWSPDGKQIAYQWWSNLIELWVIGLDGSKPRILYSPEEEEEWIRPYDWTPDGRQILACLAGKDGKNKILLVSAADGSVRVLKTLDKYYGLRLPSWYTPKGMSFSPDGHYIVYDFPQKEDSHDISLMSTDGSREIPLVEHPASDYVLGWAPDGKNILFASDRTGTMCVWLIAVAEGKPQGAPELVKPDIGRFHPMGLTGDGSFYYCHRPNKTDVYITEIDPETGKIVVPPHEAIKSFVESNATPAYSPNGKYLAYISRRPPLMKMRNTTISIGNVLCIRSLETGDEREFKPEINSFGFPQWSLDSRSIMVVNFEDDNKHAGHYRIDAQTGEVKLVVMSEDNRVHAHLWCADGKSIFLVRSVRTGDRDKHFCQIVVRDIESGAETELYRGSRSDVFTISLSPDGKWLAFLDKAKKRTLRIMPATGGEPREIHIFDKEDNRYITHTWTADGKYILMPKFRPPKADGKWDLWRIPVEDGEPQNFGFEMASIWRLSAHPDGQHIAFSTTTSGPAEVWVMENFLPAALRSISKIPGE